MQVPSECTELVVAAVLAEMAWTAMPKIRWFAKRPMRKQSPRFSPLQVAVLQNNFNQNRYPEKSQRKLISDVIGLSDRQILTWYQNRRAVKRRSV